MAYATSEQKSTSIDQENKDNTLANTTVMAYATSEQKSTSIDQENEDNTLANTTVMAYATSETKTENNQSDDSLPKTSIIAYATPQSTKSSNEATLNTTVIVYATPETTKSSESGDTIYSETTIFAYASPGKTQEFKTSESSFLSTVTQSSTLKTTLIENDDSEFKCPHASGLYPNRESCDRFWHCSNFIPFDKKCPGNLVFDNKLKVCAWTSDSCKQTLKKLLSYDLMRLDSPYFKLTLPVNNESDDVFVCPEVDGLFENKKNCKSFWQCYRGVPYLKMCAGDLVFNKKIGVCDYHSNLFSS
ncbi:putative chitinase 3 [Brachionus plicatilis]|uniref:Putative chitinase 3 n=1 Tax=Brachionus plicatilis TaxID=10195 RepID=A0A3M7TA17_BRAPC|nr:putative chitinase 3 [Brachionus plicatilis]